MTAGAQQCSVPYQGSHPLDQPQAQVRRVVLAVHSLSYQAQEAYNAVLIARGRHLGAVDEVCLLAPQFLERSQLPASIPEDLLYWNAFPFRGYSTARVGQQGGFLNLSVFEVLDQLLAAVTDAELFPNLETVVIVGFSAGGQLINRYAIAGRQPATLPSDRPLHVRYLVLSPSSYQYFTPERDPDGDGRFAVPAAAAECPEYDGLGYGLQSLYSYPAETGVETMKDQYARRFVFYLAGGEDRDPDDPSLGSSCAAMAQGSDRLSRAIAYFRHLEMVFGPAIHLRQAQLTLPGIGHSYSGLLNTAAGRRYLFDLDEVDSDGDRQSDWAEWIAHTDSGRKEERFVAAWATNQAEPVLQWMGAPGRRYEIRRSAEPGGQAQSVAWLTTEQTGDLMHWALPQEATSAWYAVRVRLQ